MTKYSKKKSSTHKKHHRKHRTRKNMRGGDGGVVDMVSNASDTLGQGAENMATQEKQAVGIEKKPSMLESFGLGNIFGSSGGGRRKRRKKSSRRIKKSKK
jgi:hypothetical protein